MSMRWIKSVLIDGQKSSLEIFLGEHIIGDKTYVRIGQTPEEWFVNRFNDRTSIISQGKTILQKHLHGRTVTDLKQKPFCWDADD